MHETANTKAPLQSVRVQLIETSILPTTNGKVEINTSYTINTSTYIYQMINRVQIRILMSLSLPRCLPKCLLCASSQHLMHWDKVVSNGLVNYAGALVLVHQIVFASRMPKCLKSAEMQGGI